MSFAPGRPGAKKSKEQAKKDKDFAEAKLRMLERAEKNLAKKNAKERELTPQEKAQKQLRELTEQPPHERDLNEMSKGLLLVADLGKANFLDEMTHRRLLVVVTEHFKNSVICSNAMYCIGMCAMQSFSNESPNRLVPPAREREDGIHGTAGIDVRSIDYVELNPKKPINPARLRQQATEQKARIEAFVEEILGRESTDLNDLWFATIVTIIAAIRAHQADTLVMSNGIFALGRLAQSATGLKNYVGILRGVETIVNSMAMHDHDNIMASNGCLAIARICHLPDIDSREDKELAQKALDTNAEIQEKALAEGALNAVLTAEARHGADPVVSRAFAEAVAGLSVANTHLSMEDIGNTARRICKAMSYDYHEIREKTDLYPTVFDEVHGRDEFVTAYGAKALGCMALVKNLHKLAGEDRRFPYVTSDPAKQDAIADAGGIECMCLALKQFPKKKDTVLPLCAAAIAHSIRLHERNQRLFVKHRGVEFVMALMDKWEEDHDFYFLLLRTLRVLLEGSDGLRNYWFLDTNKGRDVGKFVVKTYATEAKEFGTQEDIAEARDMAAQWLPDKKKQ